MDRALRLAPALAVSLASRLVGPRLQRHRRAQRGSRDPDFVDPDAEAGIFRLSPPGDGSLARRTARGRGFAPALCVRTGACAPGTEAPGGRDVGGDLGSVPVSSRAWVILDGAPAGTVSTLTHSLVYEP